MPQELRKITDLKPGLLRCSVFNGMFPDEYAVEIAVEGNRKASFFAAKSDLESVDMNQHTGLLKVKFFGERPNYVVLPSTTLEQGNNVVNVPQGTLVVA
jgi:hypothetical protein